MAQGKVVGVCQPHRAGGQRALLELFAATGRRGWDRELPRREQREPLTSRELLRRWFEPVLPPGPLPWNLRVVLAILDEALAQAPQASGLLLTDVERAAPPPPADAAGAFWRAPEGQPPAGGPAPGVEALDLLLGARAGGGPGWSRLALSVQLHLPIPWAEILLRLHHPAAAVALVEVAPLSGEALQARAAATQLPWSEADLQAFGEETGFDSWIAGAVLGAAARYRWSLPRALVYAIEDEGPLDSLLHGTWVEMRRDPGLRALLDELALPDEGAGLAIEPGPVGGPRWERLAFLYGRHLLRYTGEGFLGPCPLLKRWLR